MSSGKATRRAGQGWPRSRGVISGYVFKLARESTRLTQVALAETLGVDVATVQAWESGRRPLGAMRANQLAQLRGRMIRLGVPPGLFDVLLEALEADLVISGALDTDWTATSPQEHPLAASVHRQTLTNLITWPFTGIVPVAVAKLRREQLARRGPVSDRPVLTAEERTRFFDHLLAVADAHRGEDFALLRRQAVYLLGFDARMGTVDWLTCDHRNAVRKIKSIDSAIDDVPSWVAVRSSAVALARAGDREPLRAYVSAGLNDQICESVNLNYWAYWVGETSRTEVDDKFMTDVDGVSWTGATLFDHLLNRIAPDADHADLNIHTLWALLLARPAMLDRQPRSRAQLGVLIERMIDTPDLGPRARQELAAVSYALRLAGR